MRAGNCDKCRSPGKENCSQPCDKLNAELTRTEKGQKKHRIKIVYEYQMSGAQKAMFNNLTYAGGGFDDES